MSVNCSYAATSRSTLTSRYHNEATASRAVQEQNPDGFSWMNLWQTTCRTTCHLNRCFLLFFLGFCLLIDRGSRRMAREREWMTFQQMFMAVLKAHHQKQREVGGIKAPHHLDMKSLKLEYLHNTMNPYIHPYIHLLPLFQCWVVVAGGSAGMFQTSYSPATLPSFSWGIQRHSQAWWDRYVIPPASSGSTQGSHRSCPFNSKGRHPGGILIRCPVYLSWLLSTQRSSSSSYTPPYNQHY